MKNIANRIENWKNIGFVRGYVLTVVWIGFVISTSNLITSITHRLISDHELYTGIICIAITIWIFIKTDTVVFDHLDER